MKKLLRRGHQTKADTSVQTVNVKRPEWSIRTTQIPLSVDKAKLAELKKAREMQAISERLNKRYKQQELATKQAQYREHLRRLKRQTQ